RDKKGNIQLRGKKNRAIGEKRVNRKRPGMVSDRGRYSTYIGAGLTINEGRRAELREVNTLKRSVNSEREERRLNFVIKGINIESKRREKGQRRREVWVKEWIKERLEVECNIVAVRKSGKMTRCAKEQRGKGKEVKVGLGRLRMEGVWKGWIEKEEVERNKRNNNNARNGVKKLRGMSEIRERFTKLGKDKEENLKKLCDEELEMKREIIRKLWKERKIVKRMESKEDREEIGRGKVWREKKSKVN
ncbi:hypothetical protein ALC53_08718, partial [Atta colombica]